MSGYALAALSAGLGICCASTSTAQLLGLGIATIFLAILGLSVNQLARFLDDLVDYRLAGRPLSARTESLLNELREMYMRMRPSS